MMMLCGLVITRKACCLVAKSVYLLAIDYSSLWEYSMSGGSAILVQHQLRPALQYSPISCLSLFLEDGQPLMVCSFTSSKCILFLVASHMS